MEQCDAISYWVDVTFKDFEVKLYTITPVNTILYTQNGGLQGYTFSFMLLTAWLTLVRTALSGQYPKTYLWGSNNFTFFCSPTKQVGCGLIQTDTDRRSADANFTICVKIIYISYSTSNTDFSDLLMLKSN